MPQYLYTLTPINKFGPEYRITDVKGNEYKIHMYQIHYHGKLVGWVTNQFYKGNWRIFAIGGHQLGQRRYNEAYAFHELQEELAQIPPEQFEARKLGFVKVTTTYGQTVFINRDREGYLYGTSTNPQVIELDFLNEDEIHQLHFTFPGDKVQKIDIIPFETLINKV
jgi:hypothetical protein